MYPPYPETTIDPPSGNGAPHHGDPGVQLLAHRYTPPALTVAISRETGSRGATIGKRVSQRLGWTYYDQELLQYLAQGERREDELLADLSDDARDWVRTHVELLKQVSGIARSPKELFVVEVILAIAAKGRAVILGRGAGAILPIRSVLHVRIVAPLTDRIGWIRQLHRLTTEQAADFVQKQDKQRTTILESLFRKPSKDAALYDMVLNSSRLGEQGCAHLIADAALHKQEQRHGPGLQPGMSVETLG